MVNTLKLTAISLAVECVVDQNSKGEYHTEQATGVRCHVWCKYCLKKVYDTKSWGVDGLELWLWKYYKRYLL
ncbi:unnamed protein product, partial [Mesorhabditis spiculigera]